MTEKEYKAQRAYHDKAYTRLNIALKKPICEDFKAKIKAENKSINGFFANAAKSYIEEESTMTEKELAEQTKDLIKAKQQKPIRLPLDEQGHITVDKETQKDLYDWAVNG